MDEFDNIEFNILNEDVINKLNKDGKVELPNKKLSVPKDLRWNMKALTSKLLVGITNGSSVDIIAQSFMSVIGNNEASAIRNARTMVTAAENGGRLDSYKNLEAQGVIQKKEWMATPDDRTRPSHLEMDGEQQDIDKPFSNGCMFPGDKRGPAEEVWMCRCTMVDRIIGFRRADGSISYVNYNGDSTLHDKQINAEKKQRIKEGKSKNNVVISQSLQDAIKAYSAQGGEMASKYPFTPEKRAELTEFVNKNEIITDAELYRGFDMSEFKWEKMFNDWYDDREVAIDMSDLNSFTLNKARSYSYGGTGQHITYILPEGSAVRGLNIEKYSIYEEQETIIGGKFDKYIIDKIEFTNSGQPLVWIKRKLHNER